MKHSTNILTGRSHLATVLAVVLLAAYPFIADNNGYVGLSDAKMLVFWVVVVCTIAAFALMPGTSMSRTSLAEDFADSVGIPIGVLACCMTALLIISALFGEKIGPSILSERGPLYHLAYLCICFLLAMYGTWNWTINTAVSISVCVNALIIAAQMSGYNPFLLYPDDITYYDAHIKYSGEYLGTMGNVDILSVWLIIALAVSIGGCILAPSESTKIASALGCLAASFCGGAAGTMGFAITFCVVLVLTCIFLVTSGRQLMFWGGCATTSALGMVVGSLAQMSAKGRDVPLRPLSAVAAGLFLISSALILCGFLMRKNHTFLFPRKRWYAMWITAGAILFITGVIVIRQNVFHATSGFLYELHEIMRGNLDDSFGSHRILIWRETWSAFLESPIIGRGEPFRESVQIIFESISEQGVLLKTMVSDAHNIVLAWLLHNGILGTGAAAVLVGMIVVKALKNGGETGKMCAVAMISYLIIELTCLGGNFTDPMFWCLAGLSIANNKEKEKPPKQ